MVNCWKFSPEIRSETKMPTITTSVLYSVRGLCKKAMKKKPVIKQTNEQIYNYKNYFSLQSSNMSPSTSLNCSSFTVINLITFWFPGFFYSPFANTSFFFPIYTIQLCTEDSFPRSVWQKIEMSYWLLTYLLIFLGA